MKIDVSSINLVAAAILSASLVLIAGKSQLAPREIERSQTVEVLVPSGERSPDHDSAGSDDHNGPSDSDPDDGQLDPDDDGLNQSQQSDAPIPI